MTIALPDSTLLSPPTLRPLSRMGPAKKSKRYEKELESSDGDTGSGSEQGFDSDQNSDYESRSDIEENNIEGNGSDLHGDSDESDFQDISDEEDEMLKVPVHQALRQPLRLALLSPSVLYKIQRAIDYIKYFKLQLKLLSQDRLSCETMPFPFVSLEGYGHYIINNQNMCNDPLEEIMGNLLETNPQIANDLLERKGLSILPMDFVYTLLI